MTIVHLLEDFSASSGSHSIAMTDVSLEEHRLEAFESGYKAGWEDAVKAADEEASRISTDFAGNLQDMAFTLQEAQSGLLAALRPLLTGMVNSILPRLARQTLGTRVLETLDEVAREAADGPLEVVTAPQNLGVLQALIEERGIAAVRLIAEPSLGGGQVHVRAGGNEQEIDLDEVLARIDAAMTGFFDEARKETA